MEGGHGNGQDKPRQHAWYARRVGKLWQEFLQKAQIGMPRQGHTPHGKYPYTQVEHSAEQVVGRARLCRSVADEQEVVQFLAVFLQQQEDAEHQDVECQQTDEQTNAYHNAGDEAQKVGGFPGIERIAFGFVTFLIEISVDGRVSRIVDFHNQA